MTPTTDSFDLIKFFQLSQDIIDQMRDTNCDWESVRYASVIYQLMFRIVNNDFSLQVIKNLDHYLDNFQFIRTSSEARLSRKYQRKYHTGTEQE